MKIGGDLQGEPRLLVDARRAREGQGSKLHERGFRTQKETRGQPFLGNGEPKQALYCLSIRHRQNGQEGSLQDVAKPDIGKGNNGGASLAATKPQFPPGQKISLKPQGAGAKRPASRNRWRRP